MRSRALPIPANRTTHDATINDFTIIWTTSASVAKCEAPMPAGEIYKIFHGQANRNTQSDITYTFWNRIVIYWCSEPLGKAVVNNLFIKRRRKDIF